MQNYNSQINLSNDWVKANFTNLAITEWKEEPKKWHIIAPGTPKDHEQTHSAPTPIIHPTELKLKYYQGNLHNCIILASLCQNTTG